MAAPVSLAEVTELAAQLPAAEQQELAAIILQRLANGTQARPGRLWREIRSSVPSPLCGEDAQDWVSRGRRESDEQRAAQLRTKQ